MAEINPEYINHLEKQLHSAKIMHFKKVQEINEILKFIESTETELIKIKPKKSTETLELSDNLECSDI
jgi:hypothetical protein